MLNSNLALKKVSSFKKILLITLIALMLLVGGIITGQPVQAVSTPSGIVHSVPITIYNGASIATPTSFQQLITVDSNNYYSYEASNLQNVEFFDSSGTIIPSWLEYGTDSTYNTRYWVKLANAIPSYSSVTIYMGFASTSTNLFSSSGNVGEAPNLSSTYGQYDNGANVFSFYDNFKGTSLSSLWTKLSDTGTCTVNNGLTVTGTGSTPWESIASVSSYNPQTKELDANAYFSSPSGAGPNCFIGWNPPSSTTPQYYLGDSSGSYTLYNCATGTATPSGTTITAGSMYSYNIWNIWTDSSMSYVGLTYLQQTYSNTNFASTTSAQVGLAALSSSSVNVQWIRLRNMPPNGLMPTTTFGSATEDSAPTVSISSPTISELSVSVTCNIEAASGTTITSIDWSWGDGTTSSGEYSRTHTYSSSGSYTITVTATDSNGHTGSDSYTVYLTSGYTYTPSPPPNNLDDSVACAFNGAYATYQVSATVSGVSVTAQVTYTVSNVNTAAKTFSITTTASANGQDLSEFGVETGTTEATFSSPNPLPIASNSTLNELKSELASGTQGVSDGGSVTTPAGTFQTIKATDSTSGLSLWVDRSSGLTVKMSGTFSGVTATIELQSTNISTSSAGAFPMMFIIIIVVVIVAVVAILLVVLMVRKRKHRAPQTATQSYMPPPPPPPT